MAKSSAALTTKFDALLMRAFYRNESRVLLYPKICDTIIPYQVEIVNAFAKYFGIYFIERVKSMTYTLENPAIIREKDIDEFLLKKKHIGFRRIANGKVKEDFKNLTFFGELEKHCI
uniref:Uncharacterized protein n=1 Tax=Panagrolaimus superbus TaxID=310955 RepID=A0A914YQE6_9BILA